MEKLIKYLNLLPPGKIEDPTQLESLLAQSWNQLEVFDDSNFEPGKLFNRMEDVHWTPPELTFVIERHGATVCGSTRAELHGWCVNIDEKTASGADSGKYRQLYPKNPGLKVEPIAAEIAELIINKQEDSRLVWNKDGSVKVAIGKVIPDGHNIPKDTLSGRRKRFREAIEKILSDYGWHTVRVNVFAKSESDVKNSNCSVCDATAEGNLYQGKPFCKKHYRKEIISYFNGLYKQWEMPSEPGEDLLYIMGRLIGELCEYHPEGSYLSAARVRDRGYDFEKIDDNRFTFLIARRISNKIEKWLIDMSKCHATVIEETDNRKRHSLMLDTIELNILKDHAKEWGYTDVSDCVRRLILREINAGGTRIR